MYLTYLNATLGFLVDLRVASADGRGHGNNFFLFKRNALEIEIRLVCVKCREKLA